MYTKFWSRSRSKNTRDWPARPRLGLVSAFWRDRLNSAPRTEGFRFSHMGAALLAGTTEAVLCPFERIQTLLQSRDFHDRFRNTGHAFLDLRQFGMKEYYRGTIAILLRNGPSNVIFFGLRDPIRDYVLLNVSDHNMLANFLSGASLGVLNSFLFHPLNVVKARTQSQLGGEFRAPLAIFRLIMKERKYSIRELFRGVRVNCTRSFVSWGITNAAYDILCDKVNRWNQAS